MKHEEAAARAAKIVKAFVEVSTAHGFPPAQTCMLENWIIDALTEPPDDLPPELARQWTSREDMGGR